MTVLALLKLFKITFWLLKVSTACSTKNTLLRKLDAGCISGGCLTCIRCLCEALAVTCQVIEGYKTYNLKFWHRHWWVQFWSSYHFWLNIMDVHNFILINGVVRGANLNTWFERFSTIYAVILMAHNRDQLRMLFKGFPWVAGMTHWIDIFQQRTHVFCL